MQCPSCQTPVDSSQRFCPSCGTVLAASDPEQQDPLLGKTLEGKYKVVRLLGEGGMGAVYEGEQVLGTTKRKVAVKTLHPHLSKDPKIQARFMREVGTLAGLQHPNTIQVFDFGTTPDGILFIVMEFLQGKSLADTLEKDGPMQPDRVGNIIRQVCGSLEEAHASDIVHRDLKPDNIVLIERAGQKDFVKVLDFGIAKRSKETDSQEQKLTQQGMVLGTPPYMSPEQFTGKPIELRSDIYSLAVMAYEMLTGKLPFRADTAWEWATQHMTQPPIPIETMAEGMRAPESMRAAIQRGLAKAPEDRFASVKEFGEAFLGLGQVAGAFVVGPGSAAPRQRTEVGAPLDVAAAFPSSPGFQRQGATGTTGATPMGPPQAMGYTPVGGNVAFPTPAGIPQPPGPCRGKGGKSRSAPHRGGRRRRGEPRGHRLCAERIRRRKQAREVRRDIERDPGRPDDGPLRRSGHAEPRDSERERKFAAAGERRNQRRAARADAPRREPVGSAGCAFGYGLRGEAASLRRHRVPACAHVPREWPGSRGRAASAHLHREGWNALVGQNGCSGLQVAVAGGGRRTRQLWSVLRVRPGGPFLAHGQGFDSLKQSSAPVRLSWAKKPRCPRWGRRLRRGC